MKLRKGDNVIVISGRDKGKTGEITRVFPKQNRVLIEGVNEVKKHIKADQQNPQGGVTTKPLPIHVSNVSFLDTESGKATRLGKRREKVGDIEKSVRYSKRTGKTVDLVK